MDNNEQATVVILLFIFIIPVLILAGIALGGFIFLQGYNMLVLPNFPAFPTFTYSQSVMISTFLAYIVHNDAQNNGKSNDNSKSKVEALITALVTGLVVKPLMWLFIFFVAVNLF